MAVAKAWLDYLLQWATYASVCIEQPIQAPACRPFWTLAMFAFFEIGALVVLVIAWRVVSYRRKLAAALRAEQERAKVDHDAIAARRWDADKAPMAPSSVLKKWSAASAKRWSSATPPTSRPARS